MATIITCIKMSVYPNLLRFISLWSLKKIKQNPIMAGQNIPIPNNKASRLKNNFKKKIFYLRYKLMQGQTVNYCNSFSFWLFYFDFLWGVAYYIILSKSKYILMIISCLNWF